MRDPTTNLRLAAQMTSDTHARAALIEAIEMIERLHSENLTLRLNVTANLHRALGAMFIPPDDPCRGPVWRAFRRLGGP